MDKAECYKIFYCHEYTDRDVFTPEKYVTFTRFGNFGNKNTSFWYNNEEQLSKIECCLKSYGKIYYLN